MTQQGSGKHFFEALARSSKNFGKEEKTSTIFLIICRRQICPGGEETAGPCPLAPEERNVLYENRILGLPRYAYKKNYK
jgi:hypothetical protein